MSTEDPKLERIRKLLAKAERAATVEEADAYNLKASELMARHGVDAAMLAATGTRPDRLTELRIAMSDPYSKEKAQLACWVGAALGCRGVQHVGYGSGRTVASVTLLGFNPTSNGPRSSSRRCCCRPLGRSPRSGHRSGAASPRRRSGGPGWSGSPARSIAD